jgi:hypothetical protein
MRRSSLVHQKCEKCYNFEMWNLTCRKQYCVYDAGWGGGVAFFPQKSKVKNAKHVTSMALKPFHLVVSKYALTADP